MSLFLSFPFPCCWAPSISDVKRRQEGEKRDHKIGWNNLSEGVLPACTVILFSSRNFKPLLRESLPSGKRRFPSYQTIPHPNGDCYASSWKDTGFMLYSMCDWDKGRQRLIDGIRSRPSECPTRRVAGAPQFPYQPRGRGWAGPHGVGCVAQPCSA